MNLAQRVVVSIAWGAVLVVLGGALCASFGGSGSGAGWFMYEPNGNAVLPNDYATFSMGGADDYTGQRALVWLIVIVIWFVVSWRLFRSPRS